MSSAAAHVRGGDDALARVAPLLKLAPPWREFLAKVIREEDIKLMRAHKSTGRPLGDEEYLAILEQNLGRILRRQKPGPKPRAKRASSQTPRTEYQAALTELVGVPGTEH
jgi:putative transposase